MEFEAKLQSAAAAGVGNVAKGALRVYVVGCAVRCAAVGREEELRRVGDAEGFEPHFHVVALGETNGFRERSVQVEEIRAAAKIAAEIAKYARRSGEGEARRIEPRGIRITPDTVSNFERCHKVRRLRIARRFQGSAGACEIQRKAGHDSHDGRDAPSAKDCGGRAGGSPALALAEWEVVYEALHERLSAIEIIARVISAQIYVEIQSAIITLLEAHTLAEGIRSGCGKATSEFAVELHLQGMVARGKAGK